MSDIRNLEALRGYEQELAVRVIGRWRPAFLRSGARLLEIGPGTGVQTRLFARAGFQVVGVEIRGGAGPAVGPERLRAPKGATAPFPGPESWHLVVYDGVHLPVRRGAFEVVFSSNVLEHVWELNALEDEIHRVLCDDGLVVHVCPTSLWRVATLLTWPLYCLKRLAGRLQSGPYPQASKTPQGGQWAKRLFPPRHGVRGNVWSETLYFSRAWWGHHFEESGWRVLERRPCGLFYTGGEVLGTCLPIPARRALGAVFGSVACLWVLEKAR